MDRSNNEPHLPAIVGHQIETNLPSINSNRKDLHENKETTIASKASAHSTPRSPLSSPKSCSRNSSLSPGNESLPKIVNFSPSQSVASTPPTSVVRNRKSQIESLLNGGASSDDLLFLGMDRATTDDRPVLRTEESQNKTSPSASKQRDPLLVVGTPVKSSSMDNHVLDAVTGSPVVNPAISKDVSSLSSPTKCHSLETNSSTLLSKQKRHTDNVPSNLMGTEISVTEQRRHSDGTTGRRTDTPEGLSAVHLQEIIASSTNHQGASSHLTTSELAKLQTKELKGERRRISLLGADVIEAGGGGSDTSSTTNHPSRIRELRRLSSRKTLPGLEDVTSVRIQKRNSVKGGNGLVMGDVQTNMGEAQAVRRNSIAKTDSNHTREPVRRASVAIAGTLTKSKSTLKSINGRSTSVEVAAASVAAMINLNAIQAIGAAAPAATSSAAAVASSVGSLQDRSPPLDSITTVESQSATTDSKPTADSQQSAYFPPRGSIEIASSVSHGDAGDFSEEDLRLMKSLSMSATDDEGTTSGTENLDKLAALAVSAAYIVQQSEDSSGHHQHQHVSHSRRGSYKGGSGGGAADGKEKRRSFTVGDGSQEHKEVQRKRRKSGAGSGGPSSGKNSTAASRRSSANGEKVQKERRLSGVGLINLPARHRVIVDDTLTPVRSRMPSIVSTTAEAVEAVEKAVNSALTPVKTAEEDDLERIQGAAAILEADATNIEHVGIKQAAGTMEGIGGAMMSSSSSPMGAAAAAAAAALAGGSSNGGSEKVERERPRMARRSSLSSANLFETKRPPKDPTRAKKRKERYSLHSMPVRREDMGRFQRRLSRSIEPLEVVKIS